MSYTENPSKEEGSPAEEISRRYKLRKEFDDEWERDKELEALMLYSDCLPSRKFFKTRKGG